MILGSTSLFFALFAAAVNCNGLSQHSPMYASLDISGEKFSWKLRSLDSALPLILPEPVLWHI